MKKLGTKLTAVLSLVLVFSMVLGSTSKAFASVDNHGFNENKTTIHSYDSKYNDDEVAKVINGNQSTSDKLDSAADAQDAVKTVADAADKAEKAVEEVADLLLDAQQQYATAVSGAAVAATENSNIETAVTKLGEAENALDAKVKDEENAEDTLKSGVENYNATVETAQKAIDAAVEKLDNAIQSADQNSDNMLDKAKELKNATMPFVYWELDENGRLTGNYFTDATKLDGQYFLGYSFKREADMDTAGYHIDGYFVTLERKEEEKQPETTVVVTENGQLALNTGYEPVVLLDTVEVPEGAPEVIETEDEIEVIDLDTPVETPESAVEVLPQTGTASAVLFYILGAGCITLGGVVAHKARKEEE